MAAEDPIRNKFLGLLASVGRAGLHAAFPNEFEYYAVQFELRDSSNRVEEILVFPLLPESLQIDNSNLVSINKTASGIVDLTNHTFVPHEIKIAGSFGRKFRILVGQEVATGAAFSLNIGNNKTGLQFSAKLKTGYGVSKLLERICAKSVSLDSSGQPYRLFFYNLAFNQIHLVEVKTYSFSQALDSNMVWRYNIGMTAIAPADSIIPDLKTSIYKLLATDNLQKEINFLASTIYQELRTGVNQVAHTVDTSSFGRKLSEIV